MSINLDDYKELLEDLEPESIELLKHAWPEAVKIFSARGLDNYLKGASAIRGLGRGRSLVDCWIDEIPLVRTLLVLLLLLHFRSPPVRHAQ